MPNERQPQNNNFMPRKKMNHGHSRSAHVDGLFKVTLPQSGIAASFRLGVSGEGSSAMSRAQPQDRPPGSDPPFDAAEERLGTLESQNDGNFTPGTES